jgi:hypothetical protein
MVYVGGTEISSETRDYYLYLDGLAEPTYVQYTIVTLDSRFPKRRDRERKRRIVD